MQGHTWLDHACRQAWHYSKSSQAGTVIHGFLPVLQSSIPHPSHPDGVLLYNSALESFPVRALFRAADITMCTPRVRCLPIPPDLLSKLCTLSCSLAQAMKVCLTLGFFSILHQNNLELPLSTMFDSSQHGCRGDILVSLLGLLLVVQWTKTVQLVGNSPSF